MNSIWLRREDITDEFYTEFPENKQVLYDKYNIDEYIFQVNDLEDIELIMNIERSFPYIKFKICINCHWIDKQKDLRIIKNKLGDRDYILDYIRPVYYQARFIDQLKANIETLKKFKFYKDILAPGTYYYSANRISIVVKPLNESWGYGQLFLILSKKADTVMPMLYSQAFGKDECWPEREEMWFDLHDIKCSPILQAYNDPSENPADQDPVNLERVTTELDSLENYGSIFRYTTFLKMF